MSDPHIEAAMTAIVNILKLVPDEDRRVVLQATVNVHNAMHPDHQVTWPSQSPYEYPVPRVA